jgi:hypothetical protein
MDMQPIEPNRSLSVQLAAEQWNMVLRAVDELPHRVARPIFDSLMTQLQQQSQPQMQMSEE